MRVRTRAAQAGGAIQLLLRKRLPRSPPASSKQLELLARSWLLEGGGGGTAAADVLPNCKSMRAAARKYGACPPRRLVGQASCTSSPAVMNEQRGGDLRPSALPTTSN